ncbi:hypothetical protein DMX12_22545, partial [Pseudomonas sp. MB-090624]
MSVSQAIGAALRPIAGKPGSHRSSAELKLSVVLWEILWFLARVAGASSAPVRSSAARAAQSRAALAPTFVSGQ